MLSSRLQWLPELSPASPLAAPRSGLERSDFVLWQIASIGLDLCHLEAGEVAHG
jgi:hypothetical protein